jgi:hypothetical protein
MKDMNLGVTPPAENAGGAPWVSNSNNSDLFFEPNKGNPIENLKKGIANRGSSISNKVS